MSIAERLSALKDEVQGAEAEIKRLCMSVSPADIVEDPAFRPDLTLPTPYAGLSIYQLNQKQQELDAAQVLLNDLWLVKALFSEIEVCFDPFEDGLYVCDLGELQAASNSLQKAADKIAALREGRIALAKSLDARWTELHAIFVAKLDLLFDRFFPDSGTVCTAVCVHDEAPVALGDFLDLSRTHGDRLTDEWLAEKLRSRKRTWEQEYLRAAIIHRAELQLETDGPRSMLRVREDASGGDLAALLASLRNFVAFVNVLDMPSLKQYYSTAMSNALVEVISSNIGAFMDRREHLTAELIRTIETFTSTGWPMPLRNVFVSTDRIHESLHALHMNWLCDKYIGEVREVFVDPGFLALLAQERRVEVQVEALEAVCDAWQGAERREQDDWEKGEGQQSGAQEKHQYGVNDAEDDWNEAWASDLDVDNSAKDPTEQDDWNDHWDDEPEPLQYAENAVTTAIPTKELPAQPPTQPPTESVVPERRRVASVKTRSLTQTGVCARLADVLQQFEQESGSADPQLLLDTIMALSLGAYPPLTLLLVLVNDLAGLGHEYLCERASREWLHTKQTLFGEALALVTRSMRFSDDSGSADRDVKKAVEDLSQLVERTFAADWLRTNAYEHRQLLIQLLNLLNSSAIRQVVGNGDISELQLEKYTRYLQGLQFLEGEAMGRVGENVTKLASWPKVDQMVILLTHHLRDIMRYFYESKLYACTTEELVTVIESVFMPSDLREQCVGEIREIRSA